MATEYRAVIECVGNPCTYCNNRGETRWVQEAPDGPFESEDAARLYGVVMTRNVYGQSTHRVLVQPREVGPWGEAR